MLRRTRSSSSTKRIRSLPVGTDPVEQCYQFHRGLRRYGVDAELVVYPREGHGPREEKHRLDVLNRMIGWFEKYLKK